jgi:hypothetical protein
MSEIIIKIASTGDDLRNICLFRYQVYVSEMGRKPVYADHKDASFRHPLDDTAVNIAAYETDLNVVGGARIN